VTRHGFHRQLEVPTISLASALYCLLIIQRDRPGPQVPGCGAECPHVVVFVPGWGRVLLCEH
jgi:hypothetical protein